MSELPSDTIQNHYESAREVFEALARVGTNPTLGNNDFIGWYLKRPIDDDELIADGFQTEGRVIKIEGDDLNVLIDRVDRTLYAITSYKQPEAFDRWVPCTFEDGNTVWLGGDEAKPTPKLVDLRAVPAWGDIDLADDLKTQRGDLDDDTRATIEATLTAYVDEFADLYGSRDAVYALDSVGGAYIFGAPEATLPIAEHFEGDDDALGRVMGEFIERTNDWLEAAEERVNDAVEGASEVIHPDWVNNLNRQYKAPLSIHSKHDAVVTPLDTEAIDYVWAPIDAVDDDLITEAVEWATAFTSEEHTDAIEHLIAKLWPDEFAAEGSWQAALDAWVTEQRRLEAEGRVDLIESMLADEWAVYEACHEQAITNTRQDVIDAIDALDIEAVAEQTIVHTWTDQASGKTDTSGSGKRAFIPIWGPNAGGTANYINLEKGSWVDTGQNDHGTAIEMALISKGGWSRGKIAKGADWRKGVDELRRLGFDIPIWVPGAGTPRRDGGEYTRSPSWALRRGGYALGIIDPDDLDPREGDDGEPWLAIENGQFDAVLTALDDAGIDTGRVRWDERRDELEDLLAELEAEEGRPGPVDLYDLGRLLGQISPEDFVDLYERAADVLDCAPFEIERHRAREQYRQSFDTDEPVDLIPENGKIWHISGVPLRRGLDPILNFDWDVSAILNLPGEDTHIELDLTFDGKPIDRVVTTEIFHEAREFKKQILVEPGMLFRPGEGPVTDVLNDLDYYTYALDAPVLHGTKHMGLHGDEWVVPGGSLTPDGWTDAPQTVYIEQSVGLERQVALPMDRHEYDVGDVATILRELPNTRPTERLLPVLGWFYAAPFRPHIFDMEGEFNILNITGDTGSGKTTTLRYLWRCFGMKGEPFSANDTPFAHTRTMSATNAIPTWYDEYKPSEIDKWKLDAFHTLIRKSATGGIEQRGNADKTTDEYALHAPIVISGEQQIQPPAERRRSIMVTFKSKTTDEHSTYREAYKRLAGEAMMDAGELIIPEEYPSPENHALAYIKYVTGMDRETISRRWNDARRRVADYRDVWGAGLELDDLEVQALQTILFGWEMYCDFAERHGVNRDELPDDVAIEESLFHVASAVGPGGRRVSHLERFIELMARAAARGYLEEGQEYALVHEGTESEEVRFHIDKTFDVISKYVRDHDLTGEDLFNSAHDYRKRIRERYDDESDQLIVSYTQKTPPVGKCAGLLTSVAEDELNFDPSAFGSVDEEQLDLPTASAVPIGRLDSQRGYQTITAQVITIDTDIPESGPEMGGVLTDRSGTVDFVAWVPMIELDHDIEEDETYLMKDVRVGEYDGATQIELMPFTTIEPIQQGAGYTNLAEKGEEQGKLATNGGTQASLDDRKAPDGGEESEAASDDAPETTPDEDPDDATPASEDDIEDATGRVSEHLRVNFARGDMVSVGLLSGSLGLPPDDVEHALDNLATRGRLLRQNDGTFEVV